MYSQSNTVVDVGIAHAELLSVSVASVAVSYAVMSTSIDVGSDTVSHLVSHSNAGGYAVVMRATTAGRRSQTQQRRNDRQELLLATVEQLLEDRSFRDLTVADVMAEAQLPRTAFYRAFPDLESILLLGIDRVSEHLGDATMIWLDDATDPVGSLRPAARALIDVYRAHGRLLLAFAEAAASAPAIEKAWQASVAGFIDLATVRIEALVETGHSNLDHPRATATALVWMTERFLLESYGRGPASPDAAVAGVLELIWHRTLFA